jgi:RimJ/RimL family protein N-acetyltransferase
VTEIRLDDWTEDDLDLERRMNVPEMTVYLGGVEPDERVVARHRRMLELSRARTGRMFRVVVLPSHDPAGAVGYWRREWEGEAGYEIGWKVLPAWQGRGIAASATAAAVVRAGRDDPSRPVFAFPAVENTASNAICRKVGFTMCGECSFEYPKGHLMRCNAWRLPPPARLAPPRVDQGRMRVS